MSQELQKKITEAITEMRAKGIEPHTIKISAHDVRSLVTYWAFQENIPFGHWSRAKYMGLEVVETPRFTITGRPKSPEEITKEVW